MIAPRPALVLENVRPSLLADLPRALQHARAAGFEAVALELHSTDETFEVSGARRSSVDALTGAVRNAGLAVPILRAHVDGPTRDGVLLPGHVLEPMLDLASALGARDLVAGFGRSLLDPAQPIERQRVAHLIDGLGPMVSLAAKRGIRLLWSPPFDEVAPPHLVDEVLRAVDRPTFGIELDVTRADAAARLGGHVVTDEGKPLPGALGLLERFKGWIGAVRVVDTHTWNDAWPPIRHDDQTDWPRLLPALIDAWIPAPYWSLASLPENQAEAARGFHLRLAPYSTDAA